MMERREVVIHLPPSRAGRGRRLKNHRLNDISAIITNIVERGILYSTTPTNTLPIPIGQENISFACSLSAGKIGKMSFRIISFIASQVNIVIAQSSLPASQRDSEKENFVTRSLCSSRDSYQTNAQIFPSFGVTSTVRRPSLVLSISRMIVFHVRTSCTKFS